MKVEHYIEVKVKQRILFNIRIKRTQGFLFDMYAWFLLYNQFGTELEDITKSRPDELISKMIYTAALSSNKDKGRRVKFTKMDAFRWVEEMPNADIKKLAEVFNESMRMVKEQADRQSKKKKAS